MSVCLGDRCGASDANCIAQSMEGLLKGAIRGLFWGLYRPIRKLRALAHQGCGQSDQALRRCVEAAAFVTWLYSKIVVVGRHGTYVDIIALGLVLGRGRVRLIITKRLCQPTRFPSRRGYLLGDIALQKYSRSTQWAHGTFGCLLLSVVTAKTVRRQSQLTTHFKCSKCSILQRSDS